MENLAEKLRDDVSSSFHGLAKTYPQLEDAQMLVGSSDATADLRRQVIHRAVDVEWIQIIEDSLPYLDLVMRNPTVTIEDVEEVTPVDLARHISDKSIRHLAQHTNLIQKVDGDEITPSKILNIYREESFITYENKFVNTLIQRLFSFVTLRYQAISKGSGTQQNYSLSYDTSFTHEQEQGLASVKIGLQMEINAPLTQGITPQEESYNQTYQEQLARVEKIYHTVAAYTNSKFCKTLGNNYIRPPVIRTNAILKNKNMFVCLTLWEYLEGYSKAGYTQMDEGFQEMPSFDYIRDLYQSVSLQYVQFYAGVLENQAANRLLSHEEAQEVMPEFNTEPEAPPEDEALIDPHYEKITPVSRLISSRRKLSEAELKIREAVDAALKADELLEKIRLAREAEERRKAQEEEARRKAAEEEARRKAEEEEARRIAEEEEARRKAEEEEARRIAEEEEARRKAEEEKLAAEEAEKARIAAEEEARRLAEEAALVKEELEALRLAAEEQAQLDAVQAAAVQAAMEEKARREAEEARIAEQQAIAENLYYYPREAYVSLPRKKKKHILAELNQLHKYEEALLKAKGDPSQLPAPPANRNWDEIRRWERSVIPQKKK